MLIFRIRFNGCKECNSEHSKVKSVAAVAHWKRETIPSLMNTKALDVDANRGSWPRRAMSPSLTTAFLPVRTRTSAVVSYYISTIHQRSSENRSAPTELKLAQNAQWTSSTWKLAVTASRVMYSSMIKINCLPA